MKITDFSVLFVIIIVPIFLISGYHVKEERHKQQVELKYTSALRTAVQDAGSALNMNEKQELEAGYGSSKFFRANKELALEMLYRTLYINLGIEEDRSAQQMLNTYIPAIVVIDYDGFYTLAEEEISAPNGEVVVRPMWGAKKPYAYTDSSGNIIHFTLDRYMEAFEASTNEWLKGLQDDVKDRTSISLLNDSEVYEQVRRISIVKSIQTDLAATINRHNQWADRNGVSYNFTLPTISAEEWNNTINDIGIMAFIQGMPIGDTYLNNYALGGGRLVKSPVIHAGIDLITGIKYFYRTGCSYSLTNALTSEETFTSAKEAALHGYFETPCYGANGP
ncbi:sirohydrochlorin chelatase family protein [Paenibacillus pini]|uniref:F0F1-type ATP synthase n=1 Tax=Paenibacillus pini JCM 16418 TaxID=1236976 RepID=W7YIU0_9BACL|nr:hypothetical protein [Paenibacillus pini]GAF07528.1 hypothetical protein JCM16418_1546 [Paenibacillus pini JCM 16418]